MPRTRQLTHVALVVRGQRHIGLRYWCPVACRKLDVSSGTSDLKQAEEQAKQIEARLRTGTYARPLETTWLEFRDRYDREECKPHMRKSGRRGANRALDAFETIRKPQLLADAVSQSALMDFRNRFSAGYKSRFGTRSPHTVRSTMAAVMAAFRWAEGMGMGPAVPKLAKYRPGDRKKAMHGRALTVDEVSLFRSKVAEVVGEKAAPSWTYLIRGLLESGLRIDEALNFSWDLPNTIQPRWRPGELPVLVIPGDRQKNRNDEEIPMLQGLEALLLETAEEVRTGWVFEPISLQTRVRRAIRHRRVTSEWASRILCRIGETAGIITEEARGNPPEAKPDKNPRNARLRPAKPRRTKDYHPPKFASAHDLRRTFEDRLEAAGVDPLTIARIMRHKSYETTKKHYASGNVQRDAASLRESITVAITVADCPTSSRK